MNATKLSKRQNGVIVLIVISAVFSFRPVAVWADDYCNEISAQITPLRAGSAANHYEFKITTTASSKGKSKDKTAYVSVEAAVKHIDGSRREATSTVSHRFFANWGHYSQFVSIYLPARGLDQSFKVIDAVVKKVECLKP